MTSRLLIGWGFGLVASVLGLLGSWTWDLPTGAAIVCTFGTLLGVVALLLAGRAALRRVRATGVRALAGLGIAVAGLVGLAGLLLLAVPGMDHLWLDGLEAAMPALRLAFLDADEREAYTESRQAIEEGQAELNRARQIQQRRPMGDTNDLG